MTPWERVVLHVDMDAFYASIEVLDDPGLSGLPVVVGGSGDRGVVAAASYEARRYGIRSAMPSVEARRRCPDAVFLPVRMERYKAVSEAVFECFHEIALRVEGLSLDEAFLDLSDDPAARRDPATVAAGLKARIRAVTGLCASVGVAPNKLVAKITSDMDKPDGLTVIPAGRIRERLDPLPIERLWGIGPQTASRLRRIGITTLAELAEADTQDRRLERIFGRRAERMRRRARGEDDRPVGERGRERSISAEETFGSDITDPVSLARELDALADKVCARARSAGLSAGTVGIKVRDAGFDTRTRQRSLKGRSAETEHLRRVGRELLDGWISENRGRAVRLLGFVLSDLVEDRQLGLFEERDATRLDRTVDEIRARYGTGSLRRARKLD